jgi:hypothetical protein
VQHTPSFLKRVTYCLVFVRKNIKVYLKKTDAVARRERFKTGGGPPVRPQTDELGDLSTEIIDSQQPLEGIPDDYLLYILNRGPLHSSFGRTHSFNMFHPGLQGICNAVSHLLHSYNKNKVMKLIIEEIMISNAAM